MLNRCVTYSGSGLTWEADPRHAELAVAELGLQAGRFLFHTPRAALEFPLQVEDSIVTIDGVSDADAAGCPKTRRPSCGSCPAHPTTHHGNLVVDTEGGVVEQRRENTTEWYNVRVKPSGCPIQYESWDTRLTYESGRIAAAARGLALRSANGAVKHMEIKFFWLQHNEKTQELRAEKIRCTINPVDLMTKHLDRKRLVIWCDLLNFRRDRIQLRN